MRTVVFLLLFLGLPVLLAAAIALASDTIVRKLSLSARVGGAMHLSILGLVWLGYYWGIKGSILSLDALFVGLVLLQATVWLFVDSVVLLAKGGRL